MYVTGLAYFEEVDCVADKLKLKWIIVFNTFIFLDEKHVLLSSMLEITF